MAVFIISFIFFAIAMAAMAVGVLNGREPIKGSCGGIGALGIDQSCEICGGDSTRCETETRGGQSGVATFDPSEH
ncbi:MAG: (Na+)-NQR maturation NqrM [Luminiphilus sp.]|nr:(Na+)-NQR maturation NqrM [Luminiphilus sp.]